MAGLCGADCFAFAAPAMAYRMEKKDNLFIPVPVTGQFEMISVKRLFLFLYLLFCCFSGTASALNPTEDADVPEKSATGQNFETMHPVA